jgi:DNA-binding transcriptional regulator YdaS (Cro superfamily)
MSIPASERREIAAELKINDQYLYQCLTGRRDMDPRDAVRVERATRKKLTRRQLRRDWHLVWPELVTKDHPAPEAAHQASAGA